MAAGASGAQVPSFTVQAERPVAVDSPDHVAPWGTRRDNSRNPHFNRKAYALFDGLSRPLRVLDLGCSGGGFVRDCIDDGCMAVGIEGSDYSQRARRAEWPALGGHFLFTADVTRPFTIRAGLGAEAPFRFDLITAWELVEHLEPDELPGFCENVDRHLAPDGIAIFSVSPNEEVVGGVRLHQTVQEKPWWTELFRRHGFVDRPGFSAYFNGQYVRSAKYGAPGSFHVHLVRERERGPGIPALTARDRLWDAWNGAAPQRLLRQILGD